MTQPKTTTIPRRGPKGADMWNRTLARRMGEAFAADDPQAAADVIGEAEDPTQRDTAMAAARSAGFSVCFYPMDGGIGVRVWIED